MLEAKTLPRRLTFRVGGALVALFVAGLLCHGDARADEEEDQPARALATRSVDLPAWRSSPAPKTPLLRAASDFWSGPEDQSDGGLPMLWWSVGPTADAWLGLADPAHPLYASDPNMAEASLRMRFLDLFEEHGSISVEASQPYPRVFLTAYEDEHEALREALHELRRGLAPSIEVETRLERIRPEPELLATGRVRLDAGRWTAPIQSRRVTRYVSVWGTELAQGATSVDAQPMPMMEGQDVLLRFMPGETGDLIQFWMTHLDHESTWRVDLAPLHSLSAGSAMGSIEAPVTGIRRCHGSFWLDPRSQGSRTIEFATPKGAFRLTLGFRERSAPLADLPLHLGEERTASMEEEGVPLPRLGFLRAGAALGALDFGVRSRDTDLGVEVLMTDVLHKAPHLENLEISHERHEATGTMIVMGPDPLLGLAREGLVAQERRLRGGTLELNGFTCDASAVAGLLSEGRLRAGAPCSPETLALLRGSGGQEEMTLRTPYLEGLRGGVRLGTSTPGLVDMMSDVAQDAAIVGPMASAQFDGLVGHFAVTREDAPAGDSLSVSFDGSWAYANSDGSRMEFVFRVPVSHDPKRGGATLEDLSGPAERVALPLLGFGSQDVRGSATLTGSGAHVLALAVRDGRALVLYAKVASEPR